MKVRNVDHLNLSVRSFGESAEWYGRVFGFEVVEEGLYNGAPWGVLRSEDAMLCIYEHPDYGEVSRSGTGGRHGINHFGLRITDRKAWEETVEREKIPVLYDGEVHWPHSSSWYITDPTGYEIEVALWEDGPKF